MQCRNLPWKENVFKYSFLLLGKLQPFYISALFNKSIGNGSNCFSYSETLTSV